MLTGDCLVVPDAWMLRGMLTGDYLVVPDAWLLKGMPAKDCSGGVADIRLLRGMHTQLLAQNKDCNAGGLYLAGGFSVAWAVVRSLI
jgi:hypothetical protein